MAKKKNEKADINAKIDEVIAQIKVNSKDSHFAETLVDKLLSLKGQKDVEPVELCVPLKDVINRYDYDSFEIVNCKSGIIFHAKGGYYAFVTPRMKALYEHLAFIVDLKSRFDELDEGEKTIYDNLLSATTMIMQIPIFAPSSASMLFKVANYAAEELNSFVDSLLNKELIEEHHQEIAEYENLMEALGEVEKMKEGKE